MKLKSWIPDESEIHNTHVYNLKMYSTWYNLIGWHYIDWKSATEYMEHHDDLKDMNS